MRGRRPTPTALQLARGNPGHGPINHDEPTHAPLDTEPPTEMHGNTFAVEEWRRVIATLLRGQVTIVDRSTLTAYCLKYSQWRQLEAEAARHPFIIRSPSGYPIPNPAIGMANKSCQLMLRLAVELGITPSSRSRVHAVAAEGASPVVDEFTAWQRNRRQNQP